MDREENGLTSIFNDYADSRDSVFEDEIDDFNETINNQFSETKEEPTTDLDNNSTENNINSEEEINGSDELINIEQQVITFNNEVESLKKELDEIQKNIEFGNGILSNIEVGRIDTVTNRLSKLNEESKSLILEMKNYRQIVDTVTFSVKPNEIVKKTDGLKKQLKNIKNLQIKKYNDKVSYLDEKIKKIKIEQTENSEIIELISKLSEIIPSDIKITQWKQTNYNKLLDYELLEKTETMIKQVEDKLNKKTNKTEELDSSIKYIIAELKNAKSYEDLEDISKYLETFFANLENNKDNISKEEYDKYFEEYKKIQKEIVSIKKKIHNETTYKNKYEEYSARIDEINDIIDNIQNEIEVNKGSITNTWIEEKDKVITELSEEIDKLHEELEQNKDKLDDQQYKNLYNLLMGCEISLNNISIDVLHKDMTKDKNNYEILDGKTCDIDEMLSLLRKLVEKLDITAKDKESRKIIDNLIKKIQKEIDRIEKNLELRNDDEQDKYNDMVKKIEEKKNELKEISIKYHEKCPLKVKQIKSAKNFFKKYKKQTLIIAGLASFALLCNHVIIPAIMCGNMMIWQTVPGLRPFIEFSNKILGGIIGAKEPIKNLWILKNGTAVNTPAATASLLKGLAISGVGNIALITPLLVSIKKLTKKMNAKKEANQKIIDSGISPNTIERLYAQYIRSKIEFEEFCDEYGISDEEKKSLELYDQIYQAKNKKGRGK